MEQTSLEASELPLSLYSFYLACTILPNQNKRSRKKLIKYMYKRIKNKFKANNRIKYTRIKLIKIEKGKNNWHAGKDFFLI